MAFKRRTGKTKVMWLPVTTSTAFTKDSLVTSSSGLLTAATSGTAAVDIIGVILKAVVSTDTDYATARLVPIEVPVEKNVEWEFDTASLVAADVLTYVDLTDSATVNRAASSTDVVYVTKLISAAKGWGVLNIGTR